MSGLDELYRRRYNEALKPLASAIEKQLLEYFQSEPRIDRVTTRPKSIDRFLTKAKTLVDGKPKYSEPLRQIQDQIGARIVTFYQSDVDRVARTVERYYRGIETQDVVPDSEWEFGYFGRHYILIIPPDVSDPTIDKDLIPQFFELQVKTLFQHAWSEAEHDLGYKPGAVPLDSHAKRRLAFASAQSWGADLIFNELFAERNA